MVSMTLPILICLLSGVMAYPSTKGPIPITGKSIPLVRDKFSKSAASKLLPRQNLLGGTSGHIWYTTMSLGTQSRTYKMVVDTGSVDLVFLNGVTLPDPDLSDQDMSCSDSYGGNGHSGATAGEIYNGPYNVAGSTISGLFCLSSSQTGLTNAADGFLGLGLVPSSGGLTVASKTGNNPLTASGWSSFGIYLSSQDQNGPGQLTPNGADPSYYAGEQYWAYETVLPTRQAGEQGYNGYWQFGYNGYQFDTASGSPTYGIGFIDTGNPTINLDSTTVGNIYNVLNAQGAGLPTPSHNAPSISCSLRGNTPDVVFTFASGTQYTIQSNTYIFRNGNYCTMGIIALQNDNSPSVFGNPFVQQYYTWFDYKDFYLGFNPSNG